MLTSGCSQDGIKETRPSCIPESTKNTGQNTQSLHFQDPGHQAIKVNNAHRQATGEVGPTSATAPA